jgi:hypothetical protein
MSEKIVFIHRIRNGRASLVSICKKSIKKSIHLQYIEETVTLLEKRTTAPLPTTFTLPHAPHAHTAHAHHLQLAYPVPWCAVFVLQSNLMADH